MEDVLPRMAQLLGEATGAHASRVWLHVGDELRPEVSWPADAPAVAAHPFEGGSCPTTSRARHSRSATKASSSARSRSSLPPDDPMNPTKERLARDMAAQAGLVLRNVALIEDVRESRRRIVTAQDERARKLERDIHDGAQQQLVALSVQLRLAQQLVDRDPAKAQELLSDLQTRTTETLEDLRDLARGIYPPLLADQGLAAALEAQARRSSLVVEVHPDGVGRYRQDVESAVYFCCLEALNNVAKYADASRVEIRLTSTDGELRFEVEDDGRGFDRSVTTLRDRPPGDGRPTGRDRRIDRGRQRSRARARAWSDASRSTEVRDDAPMAVGAVGPDGAPDRGHVPAGRAQRFVLGGSVLPERGDRDDRRLHDARCADRDPHRAEPDRLAPDADRRRLPPRRVHRRVPALRDPSRHRRLLRRLLRVAHELGVRVRRVPDPLDPPALPGREAAHPSVAARSRSRSCPGGVPAHRPHRQPGTDRRRLPRAAPHEPDGHPRARGIPRRRASDRRLRPARTRLVHGRRADPAVPTVRRRGAPADALVRRGRRTRDPPARSWRS